MRHIARACVKVLGLPIADAPVQPPCSHGEAAGSQAPARGNGAAASAGNAAAPAAAQQPATALDDATHLPDAATALAARNVVSDSEDEYEFRGICDVCRIVVCVPLLGAEHTVNCELGLRACAM